MANAETDISKQKLAYLSMLEWINARGLTLRTYRLREDEEVKATICLLGNGRLYHRGISLKSDADRPCKVTGTFWAMRRAIRAAMGDLKMFAELNSEAGPTLDTLFGLFGHGLYKSETLVELTPFEKKLFGVKEVSDGGTTDIGDHSGGEKTSGRTKARRSKTVARKTTG